MAVDDPEQGGNKVVQMAFAIVIIGAIVAFAMGPVRDWVNKAKKHSLKAGLKNIRDAYGALYAQRSRYPGDDLQDLLLKNGGNIADWPTDPITGSGEVTTTFTGTGGWFHDKEKHDVKVNLPGADPWGQPYEDY